MHTGLAARHHDVSQDQVNRFSTADDFERAMRVRCRNYAVAEIVQHLDDQLQHRLVVLDEQDGSRSRGPRNEKLIHGTLFAERLGRGWQVDRQSCTNSHGTRERDKAARLPHEAIDPGETKPTAFARLFGGEKGLKNAVEDVFGHSDSAVLQRQHYPWARRRRAILADEIVVALDTLERNFECAAPRHRVT